MELLPTKSLAHASPPLPARNFSLLFIDSWERLAQTSKHFVLLIAVDASQGPDETIAAAADAILTNGLASLCVWGPDCERVHDIFDEVIVARELDDRRDVN